MTARRAYVRTGLHALRARVKVAGLSAIDRRSHGARALLEWRRAVVADLGGPAVLSAQQMALVEMATRTRLYVRFRSDLESFVTPEVVARVVAQGVRERGPAWTNRYHAFVDPAGGSGGDSMTLAIAHHDVASGRCSRRPTRGPPTVQS